MAIANCKFCGKECQAGKGLAYHQNRCTQNPDRITPPIFQGSCKHCGKEYTSKSHLIVHENQCEKNPDRVVKSFPCGKCDRVFKNKQDLGNHLNRCGKEEIKEECPYCHGMYGNLKTHMKACSENPKNKRKCQHCGEMFDHREIERHERDCPHNPLVEMIDGTRHYLCPSEGCDYKHIHLPTVSKHHRFSCDKNPDREKRRTPDKISKTCPHCKSDKVFSSESGLSAHINNCDKNPDKVIEKHECPTCHKEFKTNRGLSQHRSRGCSTIKVKIPCKFCGKHYMEGPGMSTHMEICKNNPDRSERVPSRKLKIGHQVSPFASNIEKSVHSFISQNILDNKVAITSGKVGCREIDILIESKKIGVEFNGSFYHSSHPKFGVSDSSHQEKTDVMEESGYKLFHIAEHQWNSKREIWKSILRVSLNTSSNKVIKYMARKMEFRVFENSDARNFLEENHLQGFRPAKNAVGLFYKGELVSMMSFSFNNHYGCQELIRFATLKNTVVVGGAKKLFKNYLKVFNESQVVSYARRDWSSSLDNVYQRLGFSEVSRTVPGYQYIHPTKILNNLDGIQSRQVFQKHKLLGMIERGEMEKPEGDLTEKTITEYNGWYRFYDAGNLIYMWSDPNEFGDKK